ncbi:MAG TPA: DNA methyltransferase [Steroidobacteraceae bacterium]|nr:DNA methyltransferase [Steroidobacteraceae bacterium]
MTAQPYRNPDLEWLDHVQPVGLVVAPRVLDELGLTPIRQTPLDTGTVADLLNPDEDGPVLADPWTFAQAVLGWDARYVAGAPGGSEVPAELLVSLPEHGTVLQPTWALAELGDSGQRWQLLVRIESAGVQPDARGSTDGWEATPHQRFERLVRDTGVHAGVLITDRLLRLIHAPRGETSGYLTFPLRPLATAAGRPMLAGLKLLLDRDRLFTDRTERRLPALLKKSREAQTSVSTQLAEQVLGALHELLQGLTNAEGEVVRDLARTRPDHLYEGLLAVLMRLVFILYAEDRDLLPSRTDGRARELYERGYSVRGLYARLTEDAALNPDTMDERVGGWGRLVALFRLIHRGHKSGFIQARGGKLFDPEEFPFLEGRRVKEDSPRALAITDGCLLRILEGLMTIQARGRERERLSYRTLDVEQIGSVYEAVMGFTVEVAGGRVLAIKAGKNHRTPVFVDLDALLAKKGKDRIKDLKERAGRSQLSAAQTKAIEAAQSIDELTAAFDGIVDERGSPRHRVAAAGTPILQPTDERRRSGSYYTPRSLTAPIVKYALEPTFERLGPDATPDQVLDLKTCDPAMGSGAFLVEACRAIGDRLVKAWERWPVKRPKIPADEDEQLHARRLVAQRCLYGVDKNPRAVDLARLSLWLATLARDHEFTFLDHALKCGDSLVGLTREQMQCMHWDPSQGLPLLRDLVRTQFEIAVAGRAEIREAGDDVKRTIQEGRYRQIEEHSHGARMIGDAVIAAFFSSDKPRIRERARQEIESWGLGPPDEFWPWLEARAAELRSGDHPVVPFHWEIEFPEVFARERPGFDAMVGNPPFAGKNTIISSHAKNYLPWLQTLHIGAHGNSDLVAHFFRRAFGLIRKGGVFGLIATNTIGQGDTRASGLARILLDGGSILRATRRLKWPGEAAVVVSVVHMLKGEAPEPILDGRPVHRISAYLVEGDLDTSPLLMAANSGKAFQGSIVLGMGFTFDDAAAAKGEAESLAKMEELIKKEPTNASRIFPYIGGEEVNNDPRQAHRRYVIDFADWPLTRDEQLISWGEMPSQRQQECLAAHVVPADYPGHVARDFPDLIEILSRLVKPVRDKDERPARRQRWWRFGDRQPGLYAAIADLNRVLAINCGACPHMAFAFLPANMVYANTLDIVAFSTFASFAVLQSRVHELWAWFFSSTFEDRLRYTPSDCFRTFPFPAGFQSDTTLELIGETYYNHRAELMVRRNEGLTKIYNHFHARSDRSADIERLRSLHSEMDSAVLRAYGWNDLAEQAAPEFIEQEADEGKTPKTRLDWPAAFKDEIFARVLALNAERVAAERQAGIVATAEPDEEGGKEIEEVEAG